MKKTMLTIAALAAAGQAAAYQIEAGLDVNTSDYNDSFSIGADYYLNPVTENSGPFSEAAFLQKASYVGARYIDLDSDNGMLLQGRYQLNEQLFFDGGVYFGDLDGIIVGAGMYLDSSTTVAANVEDNDYYTTFGADYKQLIFRNDGTYLNLDLGLSHTSYDDDAGAGIDDSTTVTAGGDYYLDKTMSVGGEIALAFGDVEGHELTIGGEKFLQDNIAVNAGVVMTDYDDADSDVGLKLGAIARF